MEEENWHNIPNWENEVLKGERIICLHHFSYKFQVLMSQIYTCAGMETSFLMSTIVRIGSLMQVGFGTAGTEIIRSGLERGRHKGKLNNFILSA